MKVTFWGYSCCEINAVRASYITCFCTGKPAVTGSKPYVDNSEIARGKFSDLNIGRDNQLDAGLFSFSAFNSGTFYTPVLEKFLKLSYHILHQQWLGVVVVTKLLFARVA